MAICHGRPGYNPGTDLGFFQFVIAVNLFSLGVGLFLIMCDRTLHTLPYSFLLPVIIDIGTRFINCNLTMYREKGKHASKKRLVFKKWVK